MEKIILIVVAIATIYIPDVHKLSMQQLSTVLIISSVLITGILIINRIDRLDK